MDCMQLVDLFGSVRDQWIESDVAGWLAPNRIYEGVAGPVQQAMQADEVYIVTTKQARMGWGHAPCRVLPYCLPY